MQMADRLKQLGYQDIAKKTLDIVHDLNKIDNQIIELSDAWHAVEWFDSGDYGEDDVHNLLTTPPYRK